MTGDSFAALQLDIQLAAAEIVSNISLALTEVSIVLIVQRGRHGIWDCLEKSLEDRGIRVVRHLLDRNDREWLPPKAFPSQIGDSETAACIYHDPFGPSTTNLSDPSGWLLQGLRRFSSYIFVDFPHGLSDVKLADTLYRQYISALSFSGQKGSTAEAVRGYLTQSSSVEIHWEDSTNVRVTAPFVASDDLHAFEVGARILQIPLGETWLTASPDCFEGRVKLTGDGPIHTIQNGSMSKTLWSDGAKLPVVELGIGNNPKAKRIGNITLGEKALGEIHLGFGDNRLLGGDRTDVDHRDLPLPSGGRIRTTNNGVVTDLAIEDFLGSMYLKIDCGDFDRYEIVPDREVPLTEYIPASATPRRWHRLRVVGRSRDGQMHLDNLCALGVLKDALLEELILIRSPSGAILGHLGDHESNTALRPDHYEALKDAYSILARHLGPLPWRTVKIIECSLPHALALSVPGAILLDQTLAAQPNRRFWLYMVHEMVHQWIGSFGRFIERDTAAFEGLVDFIAWKVSAVVNFDAGSTIERQFQKYTHSSDAALKDKGRRVLQLNDRYPSLTALAPILRSIRSCLETEPSGQRPLLSSGILGSSNND